MKPIEGLRDILASVSHLKPERSAMKWDAKMWWGCLSLTSWVYPTHVIRAAVKSRLLETLGDSAPEACLGSAEWRSMKPLRQHGGKCAALTSLVKRGTPKCQRWSFSSPLYTTFPKTAMLPDLHNVFPAGTQRKHGRALFKRTGSSREQQDTGGKKGNNCTGTEENASSIVRNIDFSSLLTLLVMTNTDR